MPALTILIWATAITAHVWNWGRGNGKFNNEKLFVCALIALTQTVVTLGIKRLQLEETSSQTQTLERQE